jgi:HAD domain in Swiss Army Knife RNA repair proteins
VNVVFLDIDGVLNSDAWFARSPPRDWGLDHLDPEAVARVERLASDTAARIVISSTWRLVCPLDDIRAMLAAKGLRALIVDCTPEIPAEFAEGRVRAKEIASWLDAHACHAPRRGDEPVERFVILDDLEDFGPLERFCVRTRFATGLLDEHVIRASAMLIDSAPLSDGRYVDPHYLEPLQSVGIVVARRDTPRSGDSTPTRNKREYSHDDGPLLER